ncbi:MAG TPA: outer membrane beta-barrel protein [Stellaceae bacterium]|nr:outer membrane beta-barrel protein [Stellaceae bacterium]
MRGSAAIPAAALMVAAFAGLAPKAEAQVLRPATVNYGRGYVGASAGFVIPSDLHASFGGGFAGSGDFSFNTGAAGTGFVGYHFNDMLAGEAELSVASADADKFSGSINGVSIAAPIDGSLTTVMVFANAIYKPLGYRAAFSPYIGGGIGFASIDDSIDTIGGVNVASTGSETDFAANFLVGMDFAVVDRWSIGARYRFVWINTASSATSGGVNTSIGDLTEHIITATATFHF